MPNILTLNVPNPDQLLNAGAYGAGSVVQVQSGPALIGPFLDDGTVAIVTAVTSYTHYDLDGTTTTWYRTRYENAAGVVVSEWSDAFLPNQSTSLGQYVTPAMLKLRLGLTGTANDLVIDQICDETNQWIESYTGRVLAPIASATYLFDGYGLGSPYLISLGRLGARAVTSIEVGTDGVTFGSPLTSTLYTLRPLAQDRALSGEPASHIYMTTGYRLPRGYGNIRVTMTAGFAAIPDDVRGVAISIATRAWHGRQSGQTDIVGNDDTGAPIVTKIVAPEFKRTLDHYRPVMVR